MKELYSLFATVAWMLFSGIAHLSTAARSADKHISRDLVAGVINQGIWGIVLPIFAMVYFLLQQFYKNIGHDRLCKKLLAELDDNFSESKLEWSHQGDRTVTSIVYIKFSGKDIEFTLDNDKIIVSEELYFDELAKVLIDVQIHFIMMMDKGLYLSLEEMLPLTIREVKARLLEKLKQYSVQKKNRASMLQYLDRLNQEFGFFEHEWNDMDDTEGNWLVYCVFKGKPVHLIEKLERQYKELQQIIDENAELTLSIKNPVLSRENVAVSSESIRTEYLPSTLPFSVSTAPGRALKGAPVKKIGSEDFVQLPAVERQRQHLKVNFADGLQYDSDSYVEKEARVRPMQAWFLGKEPVLFSYLDPVLEQRLREQDPELLNHVTGLLSRGKVYPSGIVKSKAAGVGIFQTNELYRNVHGVTIKNASYKIKTSNNRIFGRVYRKAGGGRRTLIIFDSTIYGHGH